MLVFAVSETIVMNLNEILMALYTQTMWLLLLLFLPLLLILVRKKIEVRRKYGELPPSPPKLPIIGNLHQLGALPHQSMWKLAKKYGPVMLLQLGCIRTVIISSAEAAREVLKIHDLACCSRPPLAGIGRLTYNYLDVAFTPYGDHWRHMKKLIVLELFSLRRVQSFRFLREEEVDMMIHSISESSSSSSAAPVNLTEKLYNLTANITSRMAFGFSYRGTNFDRARFHEVVHESEAVMGSVSAGECFPYVGWIIDRLTDHHARTERVFHELDTFFQHVIDDHLKPGREKGREDMIDVLLGIEKQQADLGADQFTKDNIKAVLLNLFLGGVDTGAMTVSWAMAELARNPRVMKKAQDEVRNCVGKKGKVTEGDIDKLEYLKMVTKETLRLHPPAPLLLPRETISHCKINGHDIYPKTMIQVNVWAIGRDPEYWKNPEEFFPERFLGSSIDFKGQNFEFLPFGAGRRICPGIHMGIVTVEIALANLLYCFDWKLPKGIEPQDIILEEQTGVRLTVGQQTPLSLAPVKYIQ